jgi:hypothetical protein
MPTWRPCARVHARTQRGGDASEAGRTVLDDQLKRYAPLGADERGDAVDVDAEPARDPAQGVGGAPN